MLSLRLDPKPRIPPWQAQETIANKKGLLPSEGTGIGEARRGRESQLRASGVLEKWDDALVVEPS